MDQYNVPNISTLVTTVFVWFVSLEFRWLWLVVTGKRYLQCDGVKEIGVLDDDDRLTFGEVGLGALHKIS